MTKKEKFQAMQALINWLESQEIRPRDSAHICIMIAAGLAGCEQHVRELHELLWQTWQESEEFHRRTNR